MPDSLKAFANRCRCCLEKFFDDEKISKITNFFEIQFFAFTGEAVSSLIFHLLHLAPINLHPMISA